MGRYGRRDYPIVAPGGEAYPPRRLSSGEAKQGSYLIGQTDRLDVEPVEARSRSGRDNALSDKPCGGNNIDNIQPPAAAAVRIERKALLRGNEGAGYAMM